MAPPSNEFLKSEVERLSTELETLRSENERLTQTHIPRTDGVTHIHTGIPVEGAQAIAELVEENANLKATIADLNSAISHLRSSTVAPALSEGQTLANIMRAGGGNL